MRLSAFRVENFRCFSDTGWIDAGATPLAFVGKNESGKSALLEALAAFGAENALFDSTRDWPRSVGLARFAEDAPVVSARFHLRSDEISALIEIDPSVGSVDQLEVVRQFNGRFTINLLGVPAPRLTKDAVSALQLIERNSSIAEATRNGASEIRAGRISFQTIGVLRQLATSDDVVANIDAQRVSALTTEADHLASRWSALNWVLKNKPKFRYFNSYDLIQGELNLPEYLAQKSTDSVPQSAQLFALAAELADLPLDKLASLTAGDARGSAERSQRIDEASIRMSDAIGRIWTQRKGHRTHFKIDGPRIWIEISDGIQEQSISLDSRSAGFRWFYSFYVLFEAQASGLFSDSVLLLDEPGMALHGRAQEDLVDLMRSLGARNQILYTTHSPFMLDPDRIEDIRVVEERRGGSRVLDSLWSTDPDNSFAVQQALGFSLSRLSLDTLDQLFVEGMSDWFFVETFRRIAIEAGTPDPLNGMRIIPGTGATSLSPIATVSLAQKHRVRALVDDDSEGRAAAKLAIEKKIVRDISVAYTSLPGRDETSIEDVLGHAFYTRLVKSAYEPEIRKAKPALSVPTSGHPLVTRRCEVALEKLGIALNKTRVARWLLEHATGAGADCKIPKDVRERMGALIESIAALKPTERK